MLNNRATEALNRPHVPVVHANSSRISAGLNRVCLEKCLIPIKVREELCSEYPSYGKAI